jgi:Arc/MetJ-type ribon-helix-helix transcriptional regulator
VYVQIFKDTSMITLSTPVDSDMDQFVVDQLTKGFASKADVVRMALYKYREEVEIQEILNSEKNADAGNILYGDLDELAAKLK